MPKSKRPNRRVNEFIDPVMILLHRAISRGLDQDCREMEMERKKKERSRVYRTNCFFMLFKAIMVDFYMFKMQLKKVVLQLGSVLSLHGILSFFV